MIEKSINNYCLQIFKDSVELSQQVSYFIEFQINKSLQSNNSFQFCTCGGSTPKKIYNLLSEKNLSWEKVNIFLGDERCVPSTSENSNSLMLKNNLLKNFASKANFYEIFNKEKVNEDISKQYFISKIKEKCFGDPPVFDLTLLGLGDDGHTASLFPNKKYRDSDIAILTEGKGLRRISLTPSIISASKKLAFIVSGASKQIALKRLLDKNEPSTRTPAKLISNKSQILIFTDIDATKNLWF